MATPFMSSLDHHAADLFHLLVESVSEYAIFILDPAGCVVSWNPAAERIFGYRAEEIISKHFSCLFTPEDISTGEPSQTLEHALQNGNYVKETRRVRKDGSVFCAVTTVSDLKDSFGNHSGFAEVTRDITERKLAQQALEKERDLSAAILGSLPGVYYMYDETGHFLRWNRKFEEISGYSPQEIARMHPLDFFEADKQLVAERIKSVFATGSSEVEGVIVSKSGLRTPYYFNGIRAELDGQRCLLGMGIDISPRRQAEEALRAADQWLRLAATAANVGLWDWDLSTNQVSFSREWKSQLGYAEHEIGSSFDEWQSRVHPDDLEDALHRMRAFIADPSIKYTTEFRLRHRDGSYRWILSQGSLLFNDQKIPIRMLGSHVDVTEQRHAQMQRQQTQKMEALGQMAAGVAHDFNNVLTVINGYSALLLDELPVGDHKRGLLNKIQEAGVRAGTLTQQLLMFCRQQTVTLTILNLNNVIENMQKMLEQLIGAGITLNTDLSPVLGAVKADESQISQILLNLVVNARDAMPKGGSVTVHTRNVLPAESSTFDRPAGDYVLLSVSDTGCGMNDAVKARIFEPFFTTKPAGTGTGLGLATVHGIVKQSNGHIAVSSEPGRGTTFQVFLPRVSDIAGPNQP
jgi:two-component system cell cycle sensor histidine kinase/response regulator CckA